MITHEHRRLRHRNAADCCSPDEADTVRTLTLKWREEWRVEVAARRGELSPPSRPATIGLNGLAVHEHATGSTKRQDTEKFATAITRSEFGPFYWNGILAKRLAEALEVRKSKCGSPKRR